MSDQHKKWLNALTQLTVSVLLIAFVLSRIDLTQARSALIRPAELAWLPAALLLFNLSKIVSAVRLNIYQRHIGVFLEERKNLQLYYAGMFLNLFLPGGIGGDGYKIYVLHRVAAAPIKKLIGVTLADRLSGLLILLLLLCLLLPSLDLPIPHVVRISMLIGVAMCVAYVFLHKIPLKMTYRTMSSIFFHAIVVQLFQLACIACLLAYLQIPPSDFAAYFAVFLVSSVAAVFPVSIGGLGVREMTFLYGLNFLHLNSTAGVIASTLFFLITLISSLIGAWFLKDFLPANFLFKKMSS